MLRNEPEAGTGERAHAGAGLRVRAEMHGRVILCEALERLAPVADAVGGPAVELVGGKGAVVRQGVDVQRRDRPVAACGVLEERVPEASSIAERAVEVDGDGRRHRRRSQAT